jgi:Bacterial dnaA protein helix-turn-helix
MKTTVETMMSRQKALRAKFGMIPRPVVRVDLIRRAEPKPEVVPERKPISMDEALLKARKHPAPTTPPRVILAQEVAAKHGITFEELFLAHRRRRYVLARREYYYRAATELKHSYAQIGRFFGQDHTTVMHGVNTYAAENNLPHPSKE